MGDFKRNSSRFSRGGGGSNDAGSGGGGNSGGGFRRGGNSGGGGRSYGGNGGGGGGCGDGGGGNFPFTRIASMTIPKSAEDAAREFVENELKGSGLSLTAKVYLGKGDNELTLKNGDMLLISFKTGDKDKDFVIGHISVKN